MHKPIFRLPYPVNKGSLKNNPMERRRLADILLCLIKQSGNKPSPLQLRFRLPQPFA
nr:hypothetical protein [uncultured Kingella sp.]